MIDGYEYQQKKKRELKEFNQKNKKPMDEHLVIMGISIVILFVLLIGFSVLINLSIEETKNECESIGGKYQVVDREWSGKQMTDIYGCVK
ncbi:MULTISPECIES: hypothetical protein [unclassified Psychrobacillus]|uniref:hypothetical protein n=1 Tax=unclassified Psychrobacillus TaxID=2636677 RepID=UPI0030F55090